MKKTLFFYFVVAALSVFFLPVSAQAEEAQIIRIGFVNVDQLLKSMPQAKIARQQLEEEFGQRKKDLLAFQKKCNKTKTRLEEQKDTLNEEQQRKQLREIRACQRELKLKDEEFGEDVRMRQGEEVQRLQRLVFSTIDQIATREKYDLIVNESIVFASPRIDLSQKVLKALKNASLNGISRSTKKSK